MGGATCMGVMVVAVQSGGKPGRELPELPHHSDCDAIMRWHNDAEHARVRGHAPVELADGARLLIGLFADVHAPTPERVVTDDQTTGPNESKRPVEVGWQRLFVCVEKDGIEAFSVERRQNVERPADTNLDALTQRGAVHVLSRERGVLLVDLNRE